MSPSVWPPSPPFKRDSMLLGRRLLLRKTKMSLIYLLPSQHLIPLLSSFSPPWNTLLSLFPHQFFKTSFPNFSRPSDFLMTCVFPDSDFVSWWSRSASLVALLSLSHILSPLFLFYCLFCPHCLKICSLLIRTKAYFHCVLSMTKHYFFLPSCFELNIIIKFYSPNANVYYTSIPKWNELLILHSNICQETIGWTQNTKVKMYIYWYTFSCTVSLTYLMLLR